MANARRQFSAEQKLQIIQEADQYGITQTLRKHNLSHSVYQRWKRQFDAGGATLLKLQYHKVDPELRALQEENVRLKKIIGNQALELEFKTELLKKAMPTTGGARAYRCLPGSGCSDRQVAHLVHAPVQQLLL
jgi:putative transposase